MENCIFLLEIFIESVQLSEDIKPAKLEDIRISAEVGKSIRMNIFSIYAKADSEADNNLPVSSGKSILFSAAPKQFLEKLREHPLIVAISINNNFLGQASIPWTKEFLDLVQNAAFVPDVMDPITRKNSFDLLSKENNVMGSFSAVIKLSSFGDSIQTSFQLANQPEGASEKYLIKGARGETTFECKKFGVESSSFDLLPPPPEPSAARSIKPNDALSWMAIFDSKLDSTYSVGPNDFNIAISTTHTNGKRAASPLTFDIVSLMERPEENKYLDLRIRGGSKGFILDIAPLDPRSVSENVLPPKRSIHELSVDEIEHKLCKTGDCPGALKFKELGIEPSRVKGGGAVFTEPMPPLIGLSQTYKTFHGDLFLRPRNPEMPFVPKKDDNWAETCWRPKSRR